MLVSLVDWYTALSKTVDQGGTIYDWKWNDAEWRKAIDGGVSAEQADMLNLTFLRSRTAVNMSGHWQALTFERRATIILGKGSVAGRRFGAKPERAASN